MSEDPKPYGAILVDAAKRYGTSGMATAALALSITALATGGDEPSPVAASSRTTAEPLELATTSPKSAGPHKRLDVATDVEVSPGASITASGKVELGARLIEIDGCIGHYDAVTGVCVLSPGPWELHSACYERAASTDIGETVCEIIVRNTGTVPLKFSGYVEVSKP